MERLGWIVDLCDFNCEVLLHWSEEQVILELPVCGRCCRGEMRKMPLHPYARGTLHAPICWSLCTLQAYGATMPVPVLQLFSFSSL